MTKKKHKRKFPTKNLSTETSNVLTVNSVLNTLTDENTLTWDSVLPLLSLFPCQLYLCSSNNLYIFYLKSRYPLLTKRTPLHLYF